MRQAPGALHVRSDVIRKRLFDWPETEPLGPESYEPEVNQRVYSEMARRINAGLAGGYAVVVDAVFAKQSEREDMEKLAAEAAVPFSALWLEAPVETLKKRITKRRDDASDATPEILRKQLDYDLGQMAWQRLDCSGDIEQTVSLASELCR